MESQSSRVTSARRLPACHAGVRDECIQTPEALDRVGDEPLVLLGARYIGANECRASTERLDLRHPPSALFLLRDVVDRDVEAAFREHVGDAAADAALADGAGDERHRHQITTAISPWSPTRTS